MKPTNNALHANRRRWLKLFDASSENSLIKHKRLAAPFLSYAPNGRATILYMGKATGGDWFKRNFHGRVGERIECTERWITAVKNREYHSAFWHFFRELEKLQSNVIWTNVCKIGVRYGNPRGEYLRFQRALAIETLRLELRLYRPTLVVFATGNDFLTI